MQTRKNQRFKTSSSTAKSKGNIIFYFRYFLLMFLSNEFKQLAILGYLNYKNLLFIIFQATNCGLQIQVPKCVPEENARNINSEKDSD